MASFLAQDFKRLDHNCQLPYSYGRILQHTYRSCINISNRSNNGQTSHDEQSSPNIIDDEEARTVAVLTPTEEKILRDRLQSTIAIMGLDRQVVSGIVHDILCRRQEMIALIQGIQQLESERDPDFVDHDNTAELIRSMCEQTSRPSRLYAAHLGRALAATK